MVFSDWTLAMATRRHTTPPAGVPRRRVRRDTEPTTFPTLEPFARRLESLRHERRLTQRALAERARISTNHYQDIAHAQANPTIIVLLRLAAALGVSVVDLFEAPPPLPDDYRLGLVADLRELATTRQRLNDIVDRLAGDKHRAAPPRT